MINDRVSSSDTAYSVNFDNSNNSGGNFVSGDVYDAIVEARNTILNNELTATAAATTGSATDVVMTGMTTTPVAGTYLVIFSGWFSHSASAVTLTVSLYNGAAQKADSVRTIMPNSGGAGVSTQDMSLTLTGIVTANGTNAISVQWHTGSATATVTNRTMTLLRIG